MGMKLYVSRHGETDWNVAWKICGRTDVELTEKGRAQAEAMAQQAKAAGIEVIIASPLKRAQDTARAAAAACGVPVLTDPRLIEQNYGAFEGQSGTDPAFLANKRNFAVRYPGGESMMDVAARVYPLLDEVREKYAGKKVLLVCHGGVCRVLRTYFMDMTNEEYLNYFADNAALMEYEYPEGGRVK